VSPTTRERSTRPGEFFRTKPAPAPPAQSSGFDPDATLPMFGATRPDGSFDPNCTVPLGMRSPIAAFDSEDALRPREVQLAPRSAPAPAPVTAGTHEEWTVGEGETLSSIAERAYGDARRWPELFAANRDRLSHPRKIVAGMSLRIPR
jgi:hypothetical protein